MDENKRTKVWNGNIIKNDFTLVDVPISVAREFKRDIATRYGNIYWVKLLDLMRKAEAYEYIIAGCDTPDIGYQLPPQDKEQDKLAVEHAGSEDDAKVIKTFSKTIKGD